jgi:hypothetical protein
MKEGRWSAYDNKNLIVPDKDDFEFQGRKYRKVILDERTNATLTAIDKYWPPNSEVVTSVIREPEDSLRIIRQFLRSEGLSNKYPDAMTCGILDKIPGTNQYVWQMAWSNLLNIGIIINPPYEAVCLMDYFRNGVNKKGHKIGQSPHVRKTAFDLSGLDSLTIVKRIVEDKLIRGYLVERKQNCLHCDI